MNAPWLYRFLWKLAGEDAQVLQACGKGVRLRFGIVGFVVGFLFLTAVLAYQNTFENIFDIGPYSWLLGLLFAFIIFNIYQLNLGTISADRPEYSLGLFASFFFRIVFMAMLGLTIAKPLETVVLKRPMESLLQNVRNAQIQKALKGTNRYFQEEIDATNLLLKELQEQIADGRLTADKTKVAYLETRIQGLQFQNEATNEETSKRNRTSHFYFHGLLLLNREVPWVWYYTIGFLFLFILPFLLKITLNPKGSFCNQQMQLQKRIVEEEYQNFKDLYQILLQNHTGEPIQIEEKYLDPPFNTLRKSSKAVLGNENDLLNQLYEN